MLRHGGESSTNTTPSRRRLSAHSRGQGLGLRVINDRDRDFFLFFSQFLVATSAALLLLSLLTI